MDILVVNINNLWYTRNLIDDLNKQTYPYYLTVIDQGSTEEGTREFLCSLKDARILLNESNIPLNALWNLFYDMSEGYICFLNNDVRVKKNFVSHTTQIFEREPKVGCVVHSTNHPKYIRETNLEYVIPDDKFVQGWDFTLRREAFTEIPEELEFFGGDDWLFHHLYRNKWKVAICLSSPILHYKAKSRQYVNQAIRESDCANLKELGVGRLSYRNKYSKTVPQEDVCQMFIE